MPEGYATREEASSEEDSCRIESWMIKSDAGLGRRHAADCLMIMCFQREGDSLHTDDPFAHFCVVLSWKSLLELSTVDTVLLLLSSCKDLQIVITV